MLILSTAKGTTESHISVIVFILLDVTRFEGFARRLVQEVSSLVFYPMGDFSPLQITNMKLGLAYERKASRVDLSKISLIKGLLYVYVHALFLFD